MEEKNRQKAIELAVSSIEKEYGKGSIMRLKDGESVLNDVEAIPTGSIGLDIALGIGGYPRGASSRSTARSRAARRRSPSTRSRRPRSPAGSLPSSTQSTRSIPPMRASSA